MIWERQGWNADLQPPQNSIFPISFGTSFSLNLCPFLGPSLCELTKDTSCMPPVVYCNDNWPLDLCKHVKQKNEMLLFCKYYKQKLQWDDVRVKTLISGILFWSCYSHLSCHWPLPSFQIIVVNIYWPFTIKWGYNLKPGEKEFWMLSQPQPDNLFHHLQSHCC